MTNRVAELEAQIQKLQAEMADELAKSRDQAVADVKDTIRKYGITPSELKGVLKPLRTRKEKVAVGGESGAAPKRRGRPPKVAAA